MAWLSSPASGTSVAARGPSTLIVATARPRYSAVVAARAMATARGSCRAGSANRVVSGATASQPANENISVAAALADREPAVRRERRPVGHPRRRRRPGHRHDHHDGQQADQDQLGRGAGPQPGRGQADDGQQQRGRDGGPGQLPAAGQLGDVAGADEADDRGTAHHPGQEHPAGRPARPRSQARGRRSPSPRRPTGRAGPGPRTPRRTGRTGRAGPARPGSRPARPRPRPGPAGAAGRGRGSPRCTARRPARWSGSAGSWMSSP